MNHVIIIYENGDQTKYTTHKTYNEILHDIADREDKDGGEYVIVSITILKSRRKR